MALAAVTTWSSGQVLTASALVGEFGNIYNNGLALISPVTGNLDMNGFRLISLAAGTGGSPGLYFSSDSDSGLYRPAADTPAIAGAGVDIVRFAGVTGASTYLLVTHSAVTAVEAMRIETDGGTNTPMLLVPEGTGYVGIPSGGSAGSQLRPGLAVTGDPDTGLIQITSGTFSLMANNVEVARATGVAAATNYLNITPSATGVTVGIAPAGGDTNIDLTLSGKGSGFIRVATALVPAAVITPPPAHALHRENVPKAWVQFEGAAGVILDSYGVTSVTQDATGLYTVTVMTAMAATQYAVFTSSKQAAAQESVSCTVASQTTTAFQVRSSQGGALTNAANWLAAMAMGKQ